MISEKFIYFIKIVSIFEKGIGTPKGVFHLSAIEYRVIYRGVRDFFGKS